MKNVNLSDGEWKIMKVLWKEAPRTIAQIVNELEAETGWTKTTVFVMLKRLIAKDAVRVDDSGRLQEYYPTLRRDDATFGETESFLSRVYDGSVGMMLSSLVGGNALSKEEIDDLRKILDESEARERTSEKENGQERGGK